MMNKAFILDFKVIKELGITINQLLTLIQIENGELDIKIEDEVLDILQGKQFIKLIKSDNESIIVLREKGRSMINIFKIEDLTEYKETRQNRPQKLEHNTLVVEIVSELRLMWKGLKVGSMGSEEACKQKLTRWMESNPKYTKEDILRSARIYLASVEDIRYLQQADFFIYKRDGKEEMSRLSAFIEEKEIDNSDWTSKLN